MNNDGARQHSKAHPCPICGGWRTQASGRGVRCWGFSLSRVTFCTREEFAGQSQLHLGANAWPHERYGACRCGNQHGEDAPEPVYRNTSPRAEAPADEPDRPPRPDTDTLARIYRRYCELSPLRDDHKRYLARRGKADLEAGERYGYASLPWGYSGARKLVNALVAEFGEEAIGGTPGFYRNKRDGRLATHTGTLKTDALVIPCRDEQGRITGMVRMTVAGDAPKYMTFKNGGADFYTIAGPAWHPERARIIGPVEGPHKAHVAAVLSGGRFMGITGAHLREAHLETLQRLAPDVVVELLDADKFTNANVANQREHMLRQLQTLGCDVQTGVWEADDGKGIDDLHANGQRPRLRTFARRPAIEARKPIPLDDPAPLQRGRSLSEVQNETAGVIENFIRNRRAKHGHIKIVLSQAGIGKSTATVRMLSKYKVTARVLVATNAKAQEMAAAFPLRLQAVEGRNERNCGNFEAVQAARHKGYLPTIVCETCPLMADCRLVPGGYYAQFETGGSLVGPTEMLWSGAFLRHGELIVLDDAELPRALVDRRSVTSTTALQLADLVTADPLRDLLMVVHRCINAQTLDPERFTPPLLGVWVWDALARAAGTAGRLVNLIRLSPLAADIMPQPDEHGQMTREAIEAAPDAVLATLITLLKGEADDFEAGREFNSGLTLHPSRLELFTLKPPLVDERTDRPLLSDRAVLALDATPLPAAYDHLRSAGLVFEESYRPTVGLPRNVTVTQISERSWSKTSLRSQGNAALLESLAEWRQRYPGDREAVICALSISADVIAAGIEESRVLHFYGNRGMNSIEDADVLHVLGRPQPPDWSALQLAQALHQHEPPISPHMALRVSGYSGFRAPDGSGRALKIIDFEDSRAAAVFAAYRESELEQSVHRARLFRVDDAQAEMFELEGHRLGQDAARRRRVRVIIHGNHPIPGLRVDQLILGEQAGKPKPTPNQERADEAAQRILKAREQLEQEGVPVTARAVARAARASQNLVGRVLQENLSRPPLATFKSLKGSQRQAEQILVAPVADFTGPFGQDSPPSPTAPVPEPSLDDIFDEIVRTTGVAP